MQSRQVSDFIIADAVQTIGTAIPQHVNLVAVSKFHSAEKIYEAYQAGLRVFGENYVSELLLKATHPLLRELPNIQWHFIGHLQSNKAQSLIHSVPHLTCIQSVDTTKLADKLNNALTTPLPPSSTTPFPIYIQINTSAEESKSGIVPGHEKTLVSHIAAHCPALRIAGLMTIGNPDYTSTSANFRCLMDSRARVATILSQPPESLVLSMGMSSDWVNAVEAGATCVRIGTAIFGPRPVKSVVASERGTTPSSASTANNGELEAPSRE